MGKKGVDLSYKLSPITYKLHYFSDSIRKNSASDKMRTPSFFALSNFDPGSFPAKTKSVSLLTDEETSPPASRTRLFASSRVRDESAPVSTTLFPVNAVCFCLGG